MTTDTLTIEKISKRIWTPQQMTDPTVQEYMGKVYAFCTANNVPVIKTYDAADEANWDNDFNLALIPQKAEVADGKKRVLSQVVLAAIPTYDAVMKHDRAGDYLRRLFSQVFPNKVVLALKAGMDSVPKTVSEFIVPQKGDKSLETFDKMATATVKMVKELPGCDWVGKPQLKIILSSRAFTNAKFPGTPPEQWDFFLQYLIAEAEKLGLDPAIYRHWRETRDSVEEDAETDEAIDLQALVARHMTAETEEAEAAE